MMPFAQAALAAGVSPWNGSDSRFEHSTFTIGKNSAVPEGIVMLRISRSRA